MRIAYLEDDNEQAALIGGWLANAGHVCHRFESGNGLQRALPRESFDLYLLDWHLPDIDGLRVMSAIRERAPKAPVIFVSLRDRDDDIVQALGAGADDYLSKPVRRGELLARIEAVTRRVWGNEAPAPVELGSFLIDPRTRRVLREGAAVDLTDKEYDLAVFLFQRVGKLVSRRHILEAVWGLRADVATRTLDTHVSRLRGKLGLTADYGWRLAAVHQFGYRLERLPQ